MKKSESYFHYMNRTLLPAGGILAVLILLTSLNNLHAQEWHGDTLTIQAVTFKDPSPEGWGAQYNTYVDFPKEKNQWRKILMAQTLKCDSATAGDKYPCGEWDYIWNFLLKVPTEDSTEIFSLASFVTPYGKRLELGGEAGWTWTYDISEYAPVLKGRRELIAGNNQELLDLKFHFIKGKPARNVLAVENIYPQGHYTYEHLASDSLLKEKEIILNPDASGYRLKAVISGHGHSGPRNCCEWDSKTHTYYLNKWEHYRWNVWKDCGYNPIYPQGGTWPFDRAGWCPGTPVDEYEFEITPKVNPGDTILIDYEIEPYRDNGEKEGTFRMTHQLFSFGPENFNLDAAVVDIIRPTYQDQYRRLNPSCDAPTIVLRNEGKNLLKTVSIRYGVLGSRQQKQTWQGELRFLEEEVVVLEPLKEKRYQKPGVFSVEISKPNSELDQNTANNVLRTPFDAPQVFPGNFIISLLTNDIHRAVESRLSIVDVDGLVWFEESGFGDSTRYRFPINLPKGCYQFNFNDAMEDGISRHWWYRNSNPELIGINGQLQIESAAGDTLKVFHPDFGQELNLSFIVR